METQDLRPELFSAVPAGLVDSRHPYPGLRPGLISDVPTGLKVVPILAISGDSPIPQGRSVVGDQEGRRYKEEEDHRDDPIHRKEGGIHAP